MHLESDRIALFTGSDYYPSGGWRDFRGTFGDVESAKNAAERCVCDWWEIVNLETLTSIDSGHKDSDGELISYKQYK